MTSILKENLQRAFSLTYDLVSHLEEKSLILEIPNLPSNQIAGQLWCIVGARESYLKAIEAGCDGIDTAISPFALGTSQPATEVMVETLKNTEFDTGLDQKKLAQIADYFRPIKDQSLSNHLLNPKVLGVDIKTLLYQVPGGMRQPLLDPAPVVPTV